MFGTFSNGSDERMHAQEWYDRCWFSFDYFGSFLAYLVRECEYEDFINSFDTAEESAKELLEMNIEDFVNKEGYDEEYDFLPVGWRTRTRKSKKYLTITVSTTRIMKNTTKSLSLF